MTMTQTAKVIGVKCHNAHREQARRRDGIRRFALTQRPE
jgi:hypothetical protein